MHEIQEPVAFFLVVMSIILITPLLSERIRLPGIVGIILGGMVIGPHGFNLLADNDRMQFLSTIGLVYLMFSAGLEVDFDQFMRVRTRSLVFGLLTFSFPQLMGMGLGYLFGLNWLGMVLLGSAFASHTLIAFPILARLGVTRNEAVAITAGATVLTDIGAFIVLAIVLGANQGQLTAGYFIRLFVMLAIFAVATFYGLPRLGKLFFQRFSGHAVEFQFVLVVLFVAALTAELIGVHEVVGAFLAGLAINATLPRHSPVTGHVLFMGESFFIPVFLLYSGMITDPFTFVKSSQTLIMAAGITVVAYVSKLIAAWIASKIFHYTRDEFWTVYGLSHAQAAVTIPTLVIGLQTGLFDTNLFNAAIMMILLTSISSPLIVNRFASRLQQAKEEDDNLPLFNRILVPISHPDTQAHLLSLAALLAKTNHGTVQALNVVRDEHGKEAEMRRQKELLRSVPEALSDPNIYVESIPRVDSSFAKGILRTAEERGSTLILMGWRGKRNFQQNILGTVLDEVIWGSDTPVMVCKLTHSLMGMRRVRLLLSENTLVPSVLRRILDSNIKLAASLNVPLHILAAPSYLEPSQKILDDVEDKPLCLMETMKGPLRPHDLAAHPESDLLVVPGFGSRQRFLSRLGDLPERLATTFHGNLIILHFDR